jgi:hypothetical protein
VGPPGHQVHLNENLAVALGPGALERGLDKSRRLRRFGDGVKEFRSFQHVHCIPSSFFPLGRRDRLPVQSL